MEHKINPNKLGGAIALTAAFGMLLLGIAGNLGIYEGAVEMMRQWHEFFSLNAGGILAGMLEAAVISYAFGYLFAWFYNKLV